MRKRRIIARCVILGAAAGAIANAPTVAAHGRPVFEGLGDLPGGSFFSLAHAVSADGSTVVGRSVSSTDPSSFEAFRWTSSGGIVGIGDLGTSFVDSDARGVSADGSVIVGEATPDSAFRSVPFRWTTGSGMVALVDSGGVTPDGQAFAVSADGSVIVGVARLSGPEEAFRWTAAEDIVGLGWLPAALLDSFAFGTSGDGSVVCGISFSGAGADVETFRWTDGTGMVGMGDVPGGVFYAIAYAVSSDGSTIVGAARTSFGNDEMFVWREETGFVLPDSLHGAAFGSSANAVSADGSVVVGYGDGGAVLWDAAHGMRLVADILTNELGVDLTDRQLSSATGVSADGRSIAGNSLKTNGDREAWIARLPAASVAAPAAGTPAGANVVLASTGPNPFASRASFRLSVPAGGRRVRAVILGVDGRVVRTLVHGALAPGTHPLEWDGRDHSGWATAGGVYFLRVDTGARPHVRKLVRRP